MKDISQAAAALGKRGGSVTSDRKAAASRENGKTCQTCGQRIGVQASGGRARAAKMTAERRQEIARKAARARWAREDNSRERP